MTPRLPRSWFERNPRKSLVLVNEIRGKPAQWKNLETVWQLLRDKEKFLRYVQDETRSYLAATS